MNKELMMSSLRDLMASTSISGHRTSCAPSTNGLLQAKSYIQAAKVGIMRFAAKVCTLCGITGGAVSRNRIWGLLEARLLEKPLELRPKTIGIYSGLYLSVHTYPAAASRLTWNSMLPPHLLYPFMGAVSEAYLWELPESTGHTLLLNRTRLCVGS